jgi:RNA polymerase sigma-70 factor (ECF subfamily)
MNADLIAAARQGDRASFEALLRPLIDPAYGMAFARVGQREAAEDVVQEAALNAWRAIRTLRPGTTSIRPWFFAIVANEARSLVRAKWWSVLRLPELPLNMGGSIDPDHARSIDLRQALDRMSPDQRQLLYLFFYLDMPFEEIGPALGISAAAARARLYRITRKLRPRMEISEALK